MDVTEPHRIPPRQDGGHSQDEDSAKMNILRNPALKQMSGR